MADDAGIAAAVTAVRARITAAAVRARRDPASVLLLGATKTVPPDAIEAAARAGLTAVGENRVQELLRKRDEVHAHVRWDLIGTLQRNKVSAITGAVTLIHGVDRVELVQAIGAVAAARAHTQAILLEVNISGEVSKHGVVPGEVPDAAVAVAATAGVALRGLMTMPAPGDPATARASFARLRALAEDLERGGTGPLELSMGMSEDFEIAVEEGATIVRVGSAIFGRRPDPAGP